MRVDSEHVRPVPPPAGSRLAGLYAGADLADAYAVALPPAARRDIEPLGRFILGQQAPWVRLLLRLRDGIMARFGVKTSTQLRRSGPRESGRIGIFRIHSVADDEMVVGEDDSHLDFRTSVLLRARAGGLGEEVVVSTVVQCHNRLGRAYLAAITPFIVWWYGRCWAGRRVSAGRQGQPDRRGMGCKGGAKMRDIVGGCLCGRVRYASEAEPVFTALCHCRNCQKQAGSAFGLVVALPKGALAVEGTLATFDDAGSSGGRVYRRFCPSCGSPIISEVAAMPDLVFLKAGTLDDTSWLAPTMQIWCESAQPWVPAAPEMARFARMPAA